MKCTRIGGNYQTEIEDNEGHENYKEGRGSRMNAHVLFFIETPETDPKKPTHKQRTQPTADKRGPKQTPYNNRYPSLNKK